MLDGPFGADFWIKIRMISGHRRSGLVHPTHHWGEPGDATRCLILVGLVMVAEVITLQLEQKFMELMGVPKKSFFFLFKDKYCGI